MNYNTGQRGKKGLIGIDFIIKNLNIELAKIEGKTIAGFIEVESMIRRDMEATSPLIPVDLGNLRASWFGVTALGETRGVEGSNFIGPKKAQLRAQNKSTIAVMKQVVKKEKEPLLIMGFTANYAAPVHEMVGVNFKRPGSGAKFFQAALYRNTKRILGIMQKYAKV